MTVTAMNHFTILTDDLPATLDFYAEFLNLKPGARPPFTFPGAWLYCDGGKGTDPILHVIAGRPKAELVKGVIDHMAFSGQGLAAALGKRLSAAGVKTATSLAANVYTVEGIVKVTAVKGGRQSVRIDWTIFGPDGNTLGGVSQTRIVRKGSLDRKWGPTADAAARAAAWEISKLISP